MRYLLKIALLFFLQTNLKAQNPSQYVNPFVGTGGHGHTFPGATLPFGLVQLSPDTRIDGSWDGCSGYHYSDSIIYGFSHTHLSGTGVSDYGDIMLMPMSNSASFSTDGYASTFSHSNEKAEPGYYEVLLDNGIRAQLTVTPRVGFHRYQYPSGSSHLVLDLKHRDQLLEGEINIINTTEVAVKRISRAWAEEQHAYAHLVFSAPFEVQYNKDSSKAIFEFEKLSPSNELLLKVGFSMVSTDGAKENLHAELPGWDFKATKLAATEAWNQALNKIQVKDKDEEKLRVFYTALYHSMIHPNTATDVNGRYRGMDNKIYQVDKGSEFYTVFSLWDTFRAAHPLYTIIDRKRSLEFINTFLLMYQQGGRLPVWELAANETDCMIGYHSVSVIADAVAKGINAFNHDLAMEAMERSANWNHLGLPEYSDHGHLTIEDEHESVSKTLEYAYDDWCIAQVAKSMGKMELYEKYMRRSQYWKNLLDPETALMRPKKNAGWLPEFDPREVNNHFTEGNSWQYSFFVPQDIYGMIELMGGSDKFEAKLDELFTVESATTGREQVDITGLIGQYAHGNEPSHHMAYLYNYIGKPNKTQERIHQIMKDFYTSKPDGLIGNEDCGQMSAWYVLSAMGFYSVTPGTDYFIIGAPYLEEAVIQLENGNSFTIKAKNLSDKNKYVQAITLNGKQYEKDSYLNYSTIMKGGVMVFEMGSQPAINSNYTFPPRESVTEPLTIVPVINAKKRSFVDNMEVEIKAAYGNPKLFYAFDGSSAANDYYPYEGPFSINESKSIYAFAVEENGNRSHTIRADFYKKPNNYSIEILSRYNPQYTAGGDEGLIDGIRADENWRKGGWQGYQGQDFEAIIDLKKSKTIRKVKVGLLRDVRAWIVEPKEVLIYTSKDGENFTRVAQVGDFTFDEVYKVETFTAKAEIAPAKARYIKVKIINYGMLPDWHLGAGHDAFIFIDEIEVE